MSIVTPRLIQFVQETGFDSLPPEMVRVTKRGLVDAIACALAGTRTDRGKIAVRMARRLGGQPEATVIGAGDRVSCVNAAFANGELVNALDFDATPHLPPNVIPPLVAIAQAKRSTGRELIACITVAHELAWRLYTAMSAYTSTYIEKATSPDVFGNGN
ncbi:MAG: MmgE/PrpD family protein, partial [Burkholderiales bacterium]|nr:MmgE/PrpD family protein [Burkholderiales bacterium]